MINLIKKIGLIFFMLFIQTESIYASTGVNYIHPIIQIIRYALVILFPIIIILTILKEKDIIKSNKIYDWTIDLLSLIYAIIFIIHLIYCIFFDTIKTYSIWISILMLIFVMYIDIQVQKKSKINWNLYSELKTLKKYVSRLYFADSFIFIYAINYIAYDIDPNNSYLNLYFSFFFYYIYTIFYYFIFIKGNTNALFHLRLCNLIPILLILISFVRSNYIKQPNEMQINRINFIYFSAFIIIFIFLISIHLDIILKTYSKNIQKVFSLGNRKISFLDIFIGLFFYFWSIFCYFLDYTPLNHKLSRKATKIETSIIDSIKTSKPIIKTYKPLNKRIFTPKNALITDDNGIHQSNSFDCVNMSVEDYGNNINISCGGDKAVLKKSINNEDTYIATGTISHRNINITAFRSSTSGKIYLVTVKMSNPTPDIKSITIFFKP